MKHYRKNVRQNNYLYEIDVFGNDENLYTASIVMYQERGFKRREVLGIAVRDTNGERTRFASVEEAFIGAEEYLRVFNMQ